MLTLGGIPGTRYRVGDPDHRRTWRLKLGASSASGLVVYFAEDCWLTMSGDIELRRKRALYRATHRGTKELDIVIGGFARANMDNFDEAGMDAFERFLVQPDPSIHAWVLDGNLANAGEFGALVLAIRVHHGLPEVTNHVPAHE